MAEKPVTIEMLSDYYQNALNALTDKFNDTRYVGAFKTSEELEAFIDNNLNELECETSFAVLSLIESLFRIDFIIRVQGKDKASISKDFRAMYRKNKVIYKHPLKESLLDTWKKHHPEHTILINQLINALDYRHWVAHGRYWRFKDNPDKFRFFDSLMLYNLIVQQMGADLKTYKSLFSDP